jgi:hypothetical protein
MNCEGDYDVGIWIEEVVFQGGIAADSWGEAEENHTESQEA